MNVEKGLNNANANVQLVFKNIIKYEPDQLKQNQPTLLQNEQTSMQYKTITAAKQTFTH